MMRAMRARAKWIMLFLALAFVPGYSNRHLTQVFYTGIFKLIDICFDYI